MADYSHLKSKIRHIQDFPIKEINFKDITPLLEDRDAFKEAIDGLADAFRGEKIDKVVGIDARGFLFASAVAYLLNAGMVIVRKKGKLPYETIVREHDLEYGRGTLEIHKDAVNPDEKVLIIDDVLATGGTVEAAAKLVEDLGGIVVGVGLLLELPMGGRERLSKYHVVSLIKY